MTERNKEAKRDEVLREFHRACVRPTAEQIHDWTVRHPDFAEDIREHAVILRDWDADGVEGHDVELDDLELDQARSAALNALHEARAASQPASVEQHEITFDALIGATGWTAPKLEHQVGISREILSDLFRGRMEPPVGRPLVATLLFHFRTTEAQFHKALQYALGHPTLGHARATGQPTVVRRTYDEIIKSSSMPPERKAYWLEED